MRAAVLADLGQPVYHVGDEAIGHATAAELRRRGVEPVLLTRDTAHTRAHHGDVPVASTLTFPWPPVDRERYTGEIARVLAGDPTALPAHDQVFAFIEAIREVDALVIAGGGNLTSQYGWLLHERAAAVAVATQLGKPVVVSGQTLGPALTEHDAGVVAEMLGRARLVGLREARSVALGRDLLTRAGRPATHVVPVLDDGTFAADLPLPPGVGPLPITPGAEPPDGASALAPGNGDIAAPLASPGGIVATFAPGTGALDPAATAAALGRALDALAAHAGVPITFVPHMATPGMADADEAMHARIASHMAPGHAVLVGIEHALVAARRARDAALVVTSRFHPGVFGTAGGAAVLCLTPDDYGLARMAGVLARWGLPAAHVLPLTAAVHDDLAPALAAVWDRRTVIGAATAAHHDAWRAFHDAWWDAAVAALGGAEQTPFPPPDLHLPDPWAAPAEVSALAARHAGYLPLTAEVARLTLELDRARGLEALARGEVEALRSRSRRPWVASRTRPPGPRR